MDGSTMLLVGAGGAVVAYGCGTFGQVSGFSPVVGLPGALLFGTVMGGPGGFDGSVAGAVLGAVAYLIGRAGRKSGR